MRRTKVRKTEYIGLFVEPDLRATIEGEARRRNLKIIRFVRTMLREQLAICMLAKGATGRQRHVPRRTESEPHSSHS
jgi:hypothetical protein